jgi:acyl-CoA oxidase
MTPKPEWVQALKPSGPQGSELLKQERAQSNVPVETLSEFLFTREVLDRQDRILKILKSEDVFDKSQNYFEGRVDRIQTSLARAKRLQQLTIKHNWSKEEFHTANDLISEPTPYGLHASMFLVRLGSFRICRQS